MLQDYPQSYLVQRLKQYKEDHKPAATTDAMCLALGITYPTFHNFLKGDKTPRGGTVNAVVDFLTRHKYISAEDVAAEISASQRKSEDDMNSQKLKAGQHYVTASWMSNGEFAAIVQAVMNSSSFEDKHHILKKLFPLDFSAPE